MTIKIEGKLRVRTRKATFVLRNDKWRDEAFQTTITPEATEDGTPIHISDELEVHCEKNLGRTFLRAEVKGKSFVLGELKTNQTHSLVFSVLSVSGVEVTGRATIK